MGIFNPKPKKTSCKRRRCVWVWCGTVFFSLAVLLHADAHSPTVVTTSPHALPLIQHYVRTHARTMQALHHTHDNAMRQLTPLSRLSKTAIRRALEAQQPEKNAVVNAYPIRTKALTPGDVRATTITVTIPHPLFIVGDGARSHAWLKKNEACLAQLHATGFVVNVASRDAMRTLQHAFPKVSLMALPGDVLVRWIPLHHYPVLIVDNHLQQ